MGNVIYSVDKETYWVAYNDDLSVIHHGTLVVGQSLKTGQPNLFKTTVKTKWLNKLAEFGVTIEIEEETKPVSEETEPVSEEPEQ